MGEEAPGVELSHIKVRIEALHGVSYIPVVQIILKISSNHAVPTYLIIYTKNMIKMKNDDKEIISPAADIQAGWRRLPAN